MPSWSTGLIRYQAPSAWWSDRNTKPWHYLVLKKINWSSLAREPPGTVWQEEGHHTGRQDAGQSHHRHPVEKLLKLIYLNFIFCKSFSSSLTFFKKKKIKVDGNTSKALHSIYMWVSVLWRSSVSTQPELTSIQKCHRCASHGSETPELSSISPAFGFSSCPPSLCCYFKCE